MMERLMYKPIFEDGVWWIIREDRPELPLLAAAPELLAACKAKLADCKRNGDCGDAALMEGEYCSDECAEMAAAVEKAEGRVA